jgi:hypothetical protein
VGREDAVGRRCRQGARGVVVLFASYKARSFGGRAGKETRRALRCGVVFGKNARRLRGRCEFVCWFGRRGSAAHVGSDPFEF